MTITLLTPCVEGYPHAACGYCRLRSTPYHAVETWGVAVGALLTRAVDRDMPVCSDDREQGQARSHAITQRAHLHVSPAKRATPSQPPPPLLFRRARARAECLHCKQN
jgi:hypothetical protein